MRDLVTVESPVEIEAAWGVTWSPDDRFVYFLRKADGKSPHELLRVPSAGGAVESMGLKAQDLAAIDIAPDGTRIAFVIGAQVPQMWALRGFLPSKN